MKKGVIKKIFKKEGYTKKKGLIALIILIIALILFGGYYLISYSENCDDKVCFDDALKNCNKASWVREDSQASWIYLIKGNSVSDSCKIEVRLLKMKHGKIEVEKLQGKGMVCDVSKGYSEFPEKDISKCTGELKEEMQDIIIQRMHNYLLDNVGEIKKGFSKI